MSTECLISSLRPNMVRQLALLMMTFAAIPQLLVETFRINSTTSGGADPAHTSKDNPTQVAMYSAPNGRTDLEQSRYKNYPIPIVRKVCFLASHMGPLFPGDDDDESRTSTLPGVSRIWG